MIIVFRGGAGGSGFPAPVLQCSVTLHSTTPSSPAPDTAAPLAALRLAVSGVVQGVGFRPRVAALATSLGVSGSVRNHGTGAEIVVQGRADALDRFVAALRALRGGGLRIDALDLSAEDARPGLPLRFEIVPSIAAHPGLGGAPDLVPCAACTAELRSPGARRQGYAFTACAQCGPRYSVFVRPPYDRDHTTMAAFPLCLDCRREYDDPADRRHHAQAIACPACGPRLMWRPWRPGGAPAAPAAEGMAALAAAMRCLDDGGLVLVKGVGGYQLACRADRAAPVARLRAAKQRDAKPFALLMADLAMVQRWCHVDATEAASLQGAAGPIVLLRQRADAPMLAPAVAPGQTTWGVMLPASPLHHALMDGRAGPLVLTSGNLSGAPQPIALTEAWRALDGRGVDAVLDHDRAIQRRVDDSVGRVLAGALRPLRRGRGWAPAPWQLPPGFPAAAPLVALGGPRDNAYALVRGHQALLGAHVGDLAHAAVRGERDHALALDLAFHDFTPVAWVTQAGVPVPPQAAALPAPICVDAPHAGLAACLGDAAWPWDGGPVVGLDLADGRGPPAVLQGDYRQVHAVPELAAALQADEKGAAAALATAAFACGSGAVALLGSGGLDAQRVQTWFGHLRSAGLRVLLPCQAPPGGGGLAWGQALVALARGTSG